MSISTARKRTKVWIAVVVSAFVLTVVAAILLSAFYRSHTETGFETNLEKLGGIKGFLAQFSLEYEREESLREITLPDDKDPVFLRYGDFQSKIGFKVLEFAGKRVEERYLRLKNKSDRGKVMFAVLYTYKDRVIAAHLSTLEQGTELIPIAGFG